VYVFDVILEMMVVEPINDAPMMAFKPLPCAPTDGVLTPVIDL
jgi:hypothetical protein